MLRLFIDGAKAEDVQQGQLGDCYFPAAMAAIAKRREEAETRNQAESLVNQTQKFLADNDDKVPADVKSKVEAAVDEAKKALDSNDTATIKSAIENLSSVSQELGQAIYAASAAESTPASSPDSSRSDVMPSSSNSPDIQA